MEKQADVPARIIDCHHHFLGAGDAAHAFVKSLGAPDYTAEQYQQDAGTLPIVSTVHVEALADDGAAEVSFVESLISSGQCKVAAIVAGCNLADDDAATQLEAIKAASPRVVGIRWILDHDGEFDGGKNATHVACSRPAHTRHGGDYLREPPANARFQNGFKLLCSYGWSFDLQCCPAQLSAAAALCSSHPDVPVMINHLGKPKGLVGDSEADEGKLAEWRAGMQGMAVFPQVHVKISMLGFAVPGWTTDSSKEELIRGLVLETIELFGARRCMFNSNWHINGAVSISDADTDEISMHELYRRYAKWVEGLSVDDQDELFYRSAARFYGLGPEEIE